MVVGLQIKDNQVIHFMLVLLKQQTDVATTVTITLPRSQASPVFALWFVFNMISCILLNTNRGPKKSKKKKQKKREA